MIWRFGDFELDDERFELRRYGRRVAIAPKPLRLLLYLAGRYPAAVPREELMAALWPGVRVTQASLARAVLDARRAVGGGSDGQVVRTIRGRGYAFGEELECPGRDSRAALATPLVAADFIGRADELLRLDDALGEVEGGRARVLLVSGAPGIGKTRLVEEFRARALYRGASVGAARCCADGGSGAHWPWQAVISDLASTVEDRSPHNPLSSLLHDFSPSGQDAARARRAKLVRRDDAARRRLYHEIGESLRWAAERRPIVLLIEDLHWAGAGALQMLRYVARAVAGSAVLLVATYRNVGTPTSEILDEVVTELTSLAGAAPILRLRGLSDDEIHAYVRQTVGTAIDTATLSRVCGAVCGNPLFLRELLPEVVASSAAATPPGVLPRSVGDLFRTRIARLDAATRELAEMAAVIGDRMPIRVLLAGAGYASEVALWQVERLRREGLVDIDTEGNLAFRHDLVRSAVIDGIGQSQLAELHRRAAEAIDARGGDFASESRLAYHELAATPLCDAATAIDRAIRAAALARSGLDFSAAAVGYRQALAAMGEATDDERRCDVLLDLGEVLDLLGAVGASRQALLAAAKIARQRRSAARLARAALAMPVWRPAFGLAAPARELIEDAEQSSARRRGAGRARLLMKRALVCAIDGEHAVAGTLAERGLALAGELGDPGLIADLMSQRLALSSWGNAGSVARRLAWADAALQQTLRAGDFPAVLDCRRRRISLFLESGDGASLRRELAEFIRDSETSGCGQHAAAGLRAMLAIVEGRFAEAGVAIGEAERLADPLSVEERYFTATAQRLELPADFRDSRSVMASIEENILRFPKITPWRIAQGLVALDLGRRDLAAAVLERTADSDFADAPRDLSQVISIATLAEIAWRLGKTRHAPRLYALLQPYAGRHVSAVRGMVYAGPIDWHLGVLAVMLKRRTDVHRHFETALETTTGLDARPWRARVELSYGAFLADGDASDRARARSLTASATESAVAFGMHILASAAELYTVRLNRPPRER